MTGFVETALLVGSIAGTVLEFAGAIQQGRAYEAAADAQRQAAQQQLVAAQYQRQLRERQAEVLEQRAGQERAVSQREAIEARRRGRLISSRAQALAAASGAGALDPSIVGILGDIDTDTEVRALTALYEGEEAARGLEYGAQLERAGAEGELYAGRRAANARRFAAEMNESQASQSYLSGAGGLLQNTSSLYAKYGMKDDPTKNKLYG